MNTPVALRRLAPVWLIVIASGVGSLLFGGTPDIKVYPTSDFTDQAWLQKTHKKLGLAWNRPDTPPKAPAKAVVIVTILRDGSILPTKLHHKSGSDAWDASALDAVQKAAPLDPLPKSYPRTSLEIHFHFEYN